MPQIAKQGTPRKTTKAGGVLDRITSIEFASDEGIKILLYGKSGTGKTTLWATFPGPILVMVCSGGKKPGELRSINTPEYRKKIKQVVLHHSDEVKQVIEHVKDTGSYRTLVLDHCSGLQDMTLREILGLEELPAQKSWGMASREQYGQSGLMVKTILREMLSLDCNGVIIAQERTFGSGGGDGEETQMSEVITPTIGAAMTPSVVAWLNPAVDYIAETFIRAKMTSVKTKVGEKTIETLKRARGVEYCLRVAPHDVFTTKFRVPKGKVMPEIIVDPSYDKIIGLIQGR